MKLGSGETINMVYRHGSYNVQGPNWLKYAEIKFGILCTDRFLGGDPYADCAIRSPDHFRALQNARV